MRDKRIPCQVGLSPSLALPLARSIPPTITPFSTPSLAPFLPRGIGARAALRRPASRWLVPPAPEPGGWGVGGAGRRAPRAPGECSGPSTIPMGLACVEVRIVRRATPLPAQRAGHQRRAPSGAALPALSGAAAAASAQQASGSGATVVGAVAHPAAPGDDEARDAGRATRVSGMIAWPCHGTSPVTPTLRMGPGPDLDHAVPVLSAAPGRLRGRAGPGLRPDVDLGDGGRGGRAWGGCGFPSRSTAGSRWGTCASSTRAPATPGPRPAPARLAPPLTTDS